MHLKWAPIALYLTFFAFFGISKSMELPPICTYCNCLFNQEHNGYDIQCVKTVSSDISKIFDNTSWAINDTQAFSVYEIRLENTILSYLSTPFPRTDVQILDLANNSIYNISNNVFQSLQNMKKLILTHNNIEVIQPDAFHGEYMAGQVYPLKSLTALHLDYNRIHSLDGDMFEHCQNIEYLTLSHNPLLVIDSHTSNALTSLPNIKELDLSFTQINTLPEFFLHTPRNLEILDISGNEITAIPPSLNLAKNLKTLILNNNPITNLTKDNGFPRLTTLTNLHMRNMHQLHSIGDGALCQLINLEELYLSDSILVEISKNALSHRENGSEYETWPPIKKFHINNNKLTRLEMHVLGKWDELVELDLSDNPWTCECENQWLLDELFTIYLHVNEAAAKQMKCAAPIEMEPFTFNELKEQDKSMRCLDRYGHRPERDGSLLIGIFAGVLITIPIVLFIIYSYRRHWFGIFDDSPAAFSRQFYAKTGTTSDDF